MDEFFKTGMGQQFCNDITRIADSLSTLAENSAFREPPTVTPVALHAKVIATNPIRIAVDVPAHINVDFGLLREQKKQLIELQSMQRVKVDVEAIDGILAMIDWFQDACAAVLGEATVFPGATDEDA